MKIGPGQPPDFSGMGDDDNSQVDTANEIFKQWGHTNTDNREAARQLTFHLGSGTTLPQIVDIINEATKTGKIYSINVSIDQAQLLMSQLQQAGLGGGGGGPGQEPLPPINPKQL